MNLSALGLDKSPRSSKSRLSSVYKKSGSSPRSALKSPGRGSSFCFERLGFTALVMNNNNSTNSHTNCSLKMQKIDSITEEIQTPKLLVRVCPLSFDELEHVVEEKASTLINIVNESSFILDRDSQSFRMERVFDSSVPQSKFYQDFLKDSVFQVLSKGESKVFVIFGEKGTGKTYSLLGETDNGDNCGIMTRTIKEIFCDFDEKKTDGAVYLSISEINQENENVKISSLKIENYHHFNEFISLFRESIKNDNYCFTLDVVQKTISDSHIGKIIFIKLNGKEEFRDMMILEKNKRFLTKYLSNYPTKILLTCSGYSENIEQTKDSLVLAEEFIRNRKCLKFEKNDIRDKKIKELEFELWEYKEKLAVYQEAWNLRSNSKNLQNIGVGTSLLINECFSS